MMMKRMVAAAAYGLFLVAHAPVQAACTYSLDKQQTQVTWTGYKTNEKLGVKGSFTDVAFTSKDKAASLKELIESIKFEIDTSKLSSGDPARDANLKTLIFNLSSALKGEAVLGKITGQVASFSEEKKTSQARIDLHGQTVTKEFTVAQQGDALTFESQINLVEDFKMQPYVAALAKACEALHKGKTWPEVGLSVKTNVVKKC